MSEDRLEATIVLDASCLINLYATQHLSSILADSATQFFLSDYVYRREALWVYSIMDGVRSGQKEAIALAEQTYLTLTKLEGKTEAALYVALAAALDDGEAYSAAIALSRGWQIATDDRKVSRILKAHTENTVVLTTLDILSAWAERSSLDAHMLRQCLQAIRLGARYEPHRQHPLYDWWAEYYFFED